MNVIDRFLNVINLNPDDDYEDDDYLDEYDDPEEEDLEEESSSKRGIFKRNKNKAIEEEEEEEVKPRMAEVPPRRPAPSPEPQRKVTPFRTNRKQVEELGVCVIKPTSIDDAREITETLLRGRTVVLNLEGVNLDVAQRIIDFTSGSCYAIQGNFQKINNCMFLIAPSNVEVSGDFADLIDHLGSSGGIMTDL